MGALVQLDGDIRPVGRLHGTIHINKNAHRWDAVGEADKNKNKIKNIIFVSAVQHGTRSRVGT